MNLPGLREERKNAPPKREPAVLPQVEETKTIFTKENDDGNVKPPRPSVTIEDTGKRAEPKLAYGGKAPLRPSGDVNDRVHSLERENLKLKTKENLLELEIRK